MADIIKFLKEQKVKETGAFSKGLNKGLNIAISELSPTGCHFPSRRKGCE